MVNTISSLLYSTFACDKAARCRYLSLIPDANPQKALRRLLQAIEFGVAPDECLCALSLSGVSEAVIGRAVSGSVSAATQESLLKFKPKLSPSFALVPPSERLSHVPLNYRGLVLEGDGLMSLPENISGLNWKAQLEIVTQTSQRYRRFFDEKVRASAKRNYFGELQGFTYCPNPNQVFQVSLSGRIA